jgi:hypothetical protein
MLITLACAKQFNHIHSIYCSCFRFWYNGVHLYRHGKVPVRTSYCRVRDTLNAVHIPFRKPWYVMHKTYHELK